MIPAPVRARSVFTSWAEMVMLIRTPRQGRTCGARAAPRAAGGLRARAARRGRLVRREAGLLGLAAGALLGLAALLLLGLAGGLLLGLLALLLLALAPGGLLLGAEAGRVVARHAGDAVDDHLARADRVVVARDHEVHRIRVAVRVDEPDDRDLQPLRLAHADRLGLEVDHEDRVGRALHVGDAAEVRLELVALGHRRDALAHRQQLHRARLGPVAQVVQAADALVDRLEVREQPAQPALVDVRHAAAVGGFLDRVAGLLLGAHEQDRPAACPRGRPRTPAPCGAGARSSAGR